ncbi:hypothetical protein [Streptomyces sparsus]
MPSNMTASAVVAAAVAGTLTFGTIGTAVAASPATTPAQAPQAPQAAFPAAPLPGTEEAAGQVKALSQAGGVLTPVAKLLEAVLQAEDGQLSEAEARRHQADVTAVLDALRQTGTADGTRAAAANRAADTSKAAAELQERVDTLVRAATAKDINDVVTALTDALGSVLELVLGLLGGAAPNMPSGNTNIPQLPSTDTPNTTLPKPNVPGTTEPNVNIPDIKLPDFTLPDTNTAMPGLPG